MTEFISIELQAEVWLALADSADLGAQHLWRDHPIDSTFTVKGVQAIREQLDKVPGDEGQS